MRTCTICATNWKESQKEKGFKNHKLIHGCRKCQKGTWAKNSGLGYFDFGDYTPDKG
jgi:hypothetical protein